MGPSRIRELAIILVAVGATAIAASGQDIANRPAQDSVIGRVEIATLPFDPALVVRSATYMPSGKVLVSYADKITDNPRWVKLAVVDDDGKNVRPFFSGELPEKGKDNGIRYMVFADNMRVFLGDYILECATSIDTCTKPALYPVEYPAEVTSGDHISHRWSEMIVAPDNRHVAWTTLLSNYSAIVFLGELRKEVAGYRIVNPRIISTLDPFRKDPAHPDGVLAGPLRGGEVKQFVHGGTAISLVGATKRDTPDSVVQDLATGQIEAITDTPGYTETTIFSPDERLGITMTTRFSGRTDPAILGLMPRPYPASLNMGLSMFAYTYAVTGVRGIRPGNVGPALIDIQASKTRENYLGVNLATEDDWVFRSPMSWHPGNRKAMWIEGKRGEDLVRIRVATLPDYRPARPMSAKPTPRTLNYAWSDMTMVKQYAGANQNADAKVYGRKTGYVAYRKSPGLVEKTYVNFSDDGQKTYSGSERMQVNPRGRSTYTANVKLSGPTQGTMDLQITFGPLGGKLPAEVIFAPDASGIPLTHGYVEYGGRRLEANSLLP